MPTVFDYAYEKVGAYQRAQPKRSRFILFGGAALAILLCLFVLSPVNLTSSWDRLNTESSGPEDWLPPAPTSHSQSDASQETWWQDNEETPSSSGKHGKAEKPHHTADIDTPPKPTELGLVDVVRALYEPLKLSPTTPSWTDFDGTEFTLPPNPVWTKPMGKRIAFIDIDTRGLDGEHDIMYDGRFNWEELGHTSSGMMGHYLYALIHGYDYRFIRTKGFPDRASYWTKIPALSDVLHDYEFVISIDADAVIHHPEIPFEWLLNRWNVTEETALTMTIDPDKPWNLDPKGRIYNNCGFVVAHNIPRTHEILQSWAECPDEPNGEYPDCARWKNPWPAEQAAFGEYIRYKFNETNDVNEVPCDEANGFPGSDTECTGRFVRHLWARKGDTGNQINLGVMRVLMDRVQGEFKKEQDKIVVQRESNEFERMTEEK